MQTRLARPGDECDKENKINTFIACILSQNSFSFFFYFIHLCFIATVSQNKSRQTNSVAILLSSFDQEIFGIFLYPVLKIELELIFSVVRPDINGLLTINTFNLAEIWLNLKVFL